MFWTYAGYIFCINLFFGIISIFGAEDLLNKSFLSNAVVFFIFLYWFSRVLIQFFYFDTKSAPQGIVYKLGEYALVTLFVFFTLVYGWISLINFNIIQ
jgi:hypothetical protein